MPKEQEEPVPSSSSFGALHHKFVTRTKTEGEGSSSVSRRETTQRDLYILQIDNSDDEGGNSSNNNLPRNDSVHDVVDEDQQEAMNYVFEYLKFYQVDLFWSFLSDVCFLMGSVLYLLLSYYDWRGKSSSSKPSSSSSSIGYQIVKIMAPLLYLQNSVVDIQWALQVQKRQKMQTEMTGLWRENTTTTTITTDPPPLSPTNSSSGGLEHPSNVLASPAAADIVIASPPPWWQRLRKYAAHRRTLYAAGSFGLAALLSVVAVLLEYKHQQREAEGGEESSTASNNNKWGSILETASDHVYVISAVIAITGRRIRPWFYTSSGNLCSCGIFFEPEALEDMGDFLFLIGSLFDASLDDLAMKTIPSLSAVSSLLWFVDALLYLQSDFVMARRLKNSELGGSQFV